APEDARFVQALPRGAQIRGAQHVSGDELYRSLDGLTIARRSIDRDERQHRTGTRVRDDVDIDAMRRLVERVFGVEVNVEKASIAKPLLEIRDTLGDHFR